jgi:hypothetical protein
MKLIFSYIPTGRHTGDFFLDTWRTVSFLESDTVRHDSKYRITFGSYLEDFNSIGVVEWALNGLNSVMNELSEMEDISSRSFTAIAIKDSVTINFTIADDDNPNWPTEKATIKEVKAALEGCKRFLEMPESFDSVVEVEL